MYDPVSAPHLAPNGTAFDVVGPENAPVIALIHGLGLCRHLWADHLGALSANHRVINYDLFGHGDSAPLPDTGSMRVYSDQLAALLDHLGVARAAIVGFSIGGMINRRFALDHADRVAALCVLSSPHDRGEKGQRLVEERAASVRERGALSTMDAALTRWFTPEYLASHPQTATLVREWRLKADAESYAQATWALAHGVRELINPDPPVVAPTLVMTGERDTGSTPAMSHAIAAEIADAETVIINHYQHLGLLEDPAAFTDPVLDFLQRKMP